MKLAVHQPDFLPWAGFWARAALADRLLLVSGVQYSKGDVTTRVKVHDQWVSVSATVPADKLQTGMVYHARSLEKAIKTLEQTLVNRYEYGHRLWPLVRVMRRAIDCGNLNVVELNTLLICITSNILGLRTLILEDSEPWVGNTKTERLRQVIDRNGPYPGPVVYLSGAGGREYLGPMPGIEVRFCEVQFKNESVAQLIAQHQDPLSHLRENIKLESL